MTSSDERREVAWRLRTEVSEGECIDYAVCRIINDVLGVNGAWGAKAARILADMIDPTCTSVPCFDCAYQGTHDCPAKDSAECMAFCSRGRKRDDDQR